MSQSEHVLAMNVEQAKIELQAMCAKAGLDFDKPNFALLWQTFKAFLAIPVECYAESFMFDCYPDADKLHVNLQRIFWIEYDAKQKDYTFVTKIGCRLRYIGDRDQLLSLKYVIGGPPAEKNEIKDTLLAVESSVHFTELLRMMPVSMIIGLW